MRYECVGVDVVLSVSTCNWQLWIEAVVVNFKAIYFETYPDVLSDIAVSCAGLLIAVAYEEGRAHLSALVLEF